MLKIRSFLLLIIIISLNGCAIVHLGKTSPHEAYYWSKEGYSYKETLRFLEVDCDYSPRHSELEGQLIDNCMLENGFVYMEKVYPNSYGSLPINPGWCFDKSEGVEGRIYRSPACESYRERHPHWSRTVNVIRNFLGAYWL